ncbi:hypothetical protein KFK09_019208 [Dendrobium nobile]|uniref:Uncharacterized protein n=1 Tax=Dendrobium nobile TaxID=94219 RepID=A0A8T3AXY9_DENNO|nr:hypothetical protein KFK09_019208 [Dendrobium nobile]
MWPDNFNLVKFIISAWLYLIKKNSKMLESAIELLKVYNLVIYQHLELDVNLEWKLEFYVKTLIDELAHHTLAT